MRRAAVLAVGIAVGSAGPAPAQTADTLHVAPGEKTACLSHPYVFASTLRLAEGDRPLDVGTDFFLDADAGCLTLSTGSDEPRVLVARYAHLPLTIRGTYALEEDPRRRTPRTVAGTETPSARPEAFTGDTDLSGLSVSGSKTFGIEVGSRSDLRLRQSLHLRLTGDVAEDVSLLAILSDQDIPFQPEGNTAELDELDKVLVELRTPRAAASLGDVGIVYGGTAFLDVDRRLEGFNGEATALGGVHRTAFASAKGEFASVSFFGEDGRQGPYRLLDRAGGEGVIVVAGSERVWLNGALLRRGEEEDYIIDYGVGEVTFSSRHPVTANSQIEIDYEFSTSRYKRRVAFAGSDGVDLGRWGRLRAAFFREGDDADDPVGGELTAAERAELAALGDSTGGVSGGTRYVGPGLGDYELVTDPETGEDIFVFVDGSGDYRVTFIDVGEGQGDYEVDSELTGADRTVYRFAGAGRGTFVVRRDLPAPVERGVGDLRWELRGAGGGLVAEGALSSVDGNTLSGRNDGDNGGSALLIEGSLDTLRAGSALAAIPSLRWRRVHRDFDAPGRLRPAFFGRDWNLRGTEAIDGEDLKEAGIEVGVFERLRVHAEGGRLAVADTFRAVRHRESVSYADAWLNGSASVLRVGETDAAPGTGRLRQQSATVQVTRWAVEPRVRMASDQRIAAETGRGEQFWDWEAAVRFPLPRTGLHGDVGVGRRLDDVRDTVAAPWAPLRDARTRFLGVTGTLQRLTMNLRYEERRVQAPGASEQRRDLGRFDLRHNALRGAWTAFATLDVRTIGLRRRTKEIVADSTGFFDMFGSYVGPGGGYDVRYSDFGEETLTTQVDASSRVRWSPPVRGDGLPAWTRHAAWEGFVTLREASTLPLGTPRHLFSPGSYLDDATTLDGRVRARQTFDVLPHRRDFGLRLRHETERRLVRNQGDGTAALVEGGGESILAATVRSAPAPGWTAEGEVALTRRDNRVSVGGGGEFELATRVRTYTGRGGRRFALGGGTARISAETDHSREAGDDRRAVGWVLRPRAQWTLPGAGRLDLRGSWTTLTTREGFPALRGAGAPTLSEGWRLDVVTEARLREGVTLTATVSVDRPERLAAVTEGRIELRGTF